MPNAEEFLGLTIDLKNPCSLIGNEIQNITEPASDSVGGQTNIGLNGHSLVEANVQLSDSGGSLVTGFIGSDSRPFFSLPAEIRNRIYDFFSDPFFPLSDQLLAEHRWPLPLAFQLTCRQAHAECPKFKHPIKLPTIWSLDKENYLGDPWDKRSKSDVEDLVVYTTHGRDPRCRNPAPTIEKPFSWHSSFIFKQIKSLTFVLCALSHERKGSWCKTIDDFKFHIEGLALQCPDIERVDIVRCPRDAHKSVLPDSRSIGVSWDYAEIGIPNVEPEEWWDDEETDVECYDDSNYGVAKATLNEMRALREKHQKRLHRWAGTQTETTDTIVAKEVNELVASLREWKHSRRLSDYDKKRWFRVKFWADWSHFRLARFMDWRTQNGWMKLRVGEVEPWL